MSLSTWKDLEDPKGGGAKETKQAGKREAAEERSLFNQRTEVHPVEPPLLQLWPQHSILVVSGIKG